eukprot:gene6107-12360_t
MVKGKPPNLAELFKKFDNGLMLSLDKISKSLNKVCDKVEAKLVRCEHKMIDYVNGIKMKTSADLDQAEAIVKRELRSKVIVSEWVNGFLARTKDETLDPVTFAFARFALNVAMSYNIVPPSYFLSAKIHHLLIGLIGFESNIVIGPAIMALLHLSLHVEMKVEIVNAGVLPILLKILAFNQSSIIQIQACKLCASLALHSPNKSQISNSGCFHAILDLAAGIKENMNDEVKNYACCAITNIILLNDANRSLTIEFDAIRPLNQILQLSSREDTILNAVKALVNIAYNNTYTANTILTSQCDKTVVEVLSCTDTLRQTQLTSASLVLDPLVVADAANFLLAVVWRNIANKARIGSVGAIPVLMKRLIRHSARSSNDNSNEENEVNMLCVERVCAALASLLMYHPNHERIL